MSHSSRQFGPDTTGWFRIEINHQPVGHVVFVMDNSQPGFGAYAPGKEYWSWGSHPPFPLVAFELVGTPAMPPAPSASDLVFTLSGASGSTTFDSPQSVDVSAPKRSWSLAFTPASPAAASMVMVPAAPGVSPPGPARLDTYLDQALPGGSVGLWMVASNHDKVLFTPLGAPSLALPAGSVLTPALRL